MESWRIRLGIWAGIEAVAEGNEEEAEEKEKARNAGKENSAAA